MAKDPKEYGKKFLEELVQLFPADKQQAVRDLVLTGVPDAAVVHVGEHVLRQDDYSRGMNEAQTLRQQTEQWRADLSKWKVGIDKQLEDGTSALERLKAMDASSGHVIPGNGAPATPDLTGFVKKSDVDTLIQQALANANAYTTNYGAYMAELQAKHLREFGEVLDSTALLAFCREQGVQLDRGGYDTFVKAKRDEKAKSVHEAELKAAEQRGFERALREGSNALPYPSPDGSSEFVTLAGLDPKFDKTRAVAAAVETYSGLLREKEGVHK